MQTARAMVSRGRLARVSIAWTNGTEAVVSDVEEGIRFVRWTAGPACNMEYQPEFQAPWEGHMGGKLGRRTEEVRVEVLFRGED